MNIMSIINFLTAVLYLKIQNFKIFICCVISNFVNNLIIFLNNHTEHIFRIILKKNIFGHIGRFACGFAPPKLISGYATGPVTRTNQSKTNK